MRRLPELERLTPITQDTVLSIGELLKDGYKPNEIAVSLKLPPDFVAQRIEQLRREIEDYNKGILALGDDEYEVLKASIAEVGVHSPVLVGDHMLIDGRGRCHAANALGFTEIPASRIVGLTEQQEYDLRITLNLARRHLSREQKQALVRHELNRDPLRSDRLVGVLCGVHHSTVGSIRERLQEEEIAHGAIESVSDSDLDAYNDRKAALNPRVANLASSPAEEMSRRLGRDGKVRSSTPRPQLPPPPVPDPRDSQESTLISDPELGELMGYVRCPHGTNLRLHFYKKRSSFVLVEEPRYPDA